MRYELAGYRRVFGIALLAACYAAIGLTTSSTLLVEVGMSYRDSSYLLGILVLTYICRPFLAVPATPINVFVAYVYGPVGFVLIQLGTVLSTVPSFVAGHVSSSSTGLTGRFADVQARLGGFRSMLVITLLPIPLDVVGYSAGLARIRRRDFLAGLFVGAVPWSLGQTLAGWSLQRYRAATGDGLVWLVVVCTLLALLVLAPILYQEHSSA
ncbi:TVP38/TMEM64 family protein [Haloarcula pellucida]|uniref:VTT domain-containing protein n=1 Tax=Haloarcula pellucida TaxID=1427151 RepID=A0A830GJ20_9EURY|nr:VTT domain-containing protein [Halomicroarcula pellucida]MBX0348654.1 VTT domain-containing protein [Halomicroarcula pellucida]GGN92391.1 hypothetical protein GCM10009030_16570 [Halomicroarcula pellucida]